MRSCGSCCAIRSRPGPRPKWDTAADLPGAASRRRLVDLHVHSTASDGSLPPERWWSARGGRPRRHRADRPRHGRRACPRRWPPASAGAPGGGRLRVRSAAPWGEMHVLGYFLPSDSAELEAFLERCRADRVRRGREMVTRLQRLGVELAFDDVLLESGGGAVGRPHVARAIVRQGSASTWPTRSTATSAAAGPPSWTRCCPAFREIAELVHRSAAWCRSRTSRSGAPGRSSSGSRARGSMRWRPATRATTPELRARLTDIALAARAAAHRRQRLARRSRARRDPRRARLPGRPARMARAPGGAAARAARRPALNEPPHPVRQVRAGLHRRRLGRRDVHAARPAWRSRGCCWCSIPATTRPAETANSPPCATTCPSTPADASAPSG